MGPLLYSKFLFLLTIGFLASANFVTSIENQNAVNPVVRNTKRSTRSVLSIRSFTRTKPYQFDSNEVQDYDDPIPKMIWVPAGLEFSCKGRAPGYYSDPSPASKCQVYHICVQDGRKHSMLCGVGTIFNQITFVCDHWYNYKCSDAEKDYKRNDQLWDQFLSPKTEEQVYDDDYEEEDIDTSTSEAPSLSLPL